MITASSLPFLPKKNLPGDRNHSGILLRRMLRMLVSVEQDDEEKEREEKQTGHRSIRDGTSSSGVTRVRALFLFIFQSRQTRACLLMKKKRSFGRLLNCIHWSKTMCACVGVNVFSFFRRQTKEKRKRAPLRKNEPVYFLLLYQSIRSYDSGKLTKPVALIHRERNE